MNHKCKNPLCQNHGNAGELVTTEQHRVGRYCNRVNRFLESGGFVMIGKNTADPNPQAPFEAWAYNSHPADFENSDAVTFGLGQNAYDALVALNGLLADKIETSDYGKLQKKAFPARHCCNCRWKCPQCKHVIDWSYRRLAEAGSPYCPRCKNQVQMIMEEKPPANEMILTPCRINELIESAQSVVNNWTTGHLAESVRELDCVLKGLKSN